MTNYFKNKPKQNLWLGAVKALFIASLLSAITTGLELFDTYTAIVVSSSIIKKNLPVFCIALVLSIIFFIIQRRIKRNVYNEIEQQLDD